MNFPDAGLFPIQGSLCLPRQGEAPSRRFYVGPDHVVLREAPLPSVQDQRCYAATRLNIILQANGLPADPSSLIVPVF